MASLRHFRALRRATRPDTYSLLESPAARPHMKVHSARFAASATAANAAGHSGEAVRAVAPADIPSAPLNHTPAAPSPARPTGTEAVMAQKAAMAATNKAVFAVTQEMKLISAWIERLIDTDSPLLKRMSGYYFKSSGKYLRPALVFLMSMCTAPKGLTQWPAKYTEMQKIMNAPLNPENMISDMNPSIRALFDSKVEDTTNLDISPFQRRLAYAIEILHTATLLHDDVIDRAETRRGVKSANLEFGNKYTVLTGDFLLGRTIDWVGRTQNLEVVGIINQVIINLALGEVVQLDNTADATADPVWSEDAMNYYIKKSFLKTGSLIASSCKSAVLLGLEPRPEYAVAAFEYGKNIGIAFQLVDDVLDYTVDKAVLGKPSGADLKLGLATAPVLYAWKEHPELGKLVSRRFSAEGDVELANELVIKSGGVDKTKELARSYIDAAVAAISVFPESDAKTALIQVAEATLSRNK